MRRRWRIMAIVMVAGSMLSTGVAMAAGNDAGERGGDAIIVKPQDRSAALTKGDSTTEWTLLLPDGAECPGDSANDNWRVNTFIVPASTDVSNMRFMSIGPEGPDGDAKWALYTASPNPYVNRLTLPNDRAGEPGRLNPLPTMSFKVFKPGLLPAGRYKMGFACTSTPDMMTRRYWDTQIDIVDAPDAPPAEFRWSVVDSPGSPAAGATGSGGGSSGQWIAIAVLAAAVGAFFIIRNRSKRPAHSSLEKEHQ